MSEVQLNPKHYNEDYEPPKKCSRDYFHKYFKIEEGKKEDGDDLAQIPCACGVPRWCHRVKKTQLNNEDEFVQAYYCGRTQQYLQEKKPNAYETDDGLCTLCLSRGICCYFDDHPEGEESPLKKPKTQIQGDIEFKFTPYVPSPVVQDQETNQGNNFIPQDCKFFTFSCSDRLFNILQIRYFPAKKNDQKKEVDSKVLLEYPHKIFLRSCYKDLTDLLFVERENKDFIPTSLSVVTGVPGIGKSTLQFYLLYRFMTSKHKTKSFILSYDIQEYLFFEYISDFKYRMTSYKNITDIPNLNDRSFAKNHLCILDFSTKNEIQYKSEYLNGIVLSSPDIRRFGEYIKSQSATNKNKYFMPIWAKEELEMFSTVLSENQKSHWKSHYYYVRGVPRLLFNFYGDEDFHSTFIQQLDSLLTTKGPSIVKALTLASDLKMTNEKINNYTLIHINPTIEYSQREDSSTIKNVPVSIDYKTIRFSFASLYVENQLLTLKKHNYLSQVINLINTGMIDIEKSNDINRLFERIFLELSPPIKNRLYELPSLDAPKILHYNHPKSNVNFENSEIEKLEFDRDVFYIPKSRIFEAVDAFFLSETLVKDTSNKQIERFLAVNFIQITTAKDHSVNLKGLEKIVTFFKKFEHNPICFNLIFVVPNGSLLKKSQAISTKRANFSIDKIEINQYLFEYQIPLRSDQDTTYQNEIDNIMAVQRNSEGEM